MDAVQWAAGNLSSRDWAVNDPTSQADAKKALADLVAKLNADGRRDEAARVAALANPSRHDLVIEVKSMNEADIDLAVTEPIGSVCSSQNRQTVGGGRWRDAQRPGHEFGGGPRPGGLSREQARLHGRRGRPGRPGGGLLGPPVGAGQRRAGLPDGHRGSAD